MFKSDLLQNKVILVTGGGSGLGLSMAKRFAELGATLVICGRTPERLAGGATEIQQAGSGREVFTFSCDVREYQAVEKMMAAIIEKAGVPNVLVNNAAGNFLAATEDLSPGGFDAVVKIVLYGTFNCTQTLTKHWIAKKTPGTVLNIVTTYAENGSAFVVPSACAKAGVLAMTRSSRWNGALMAFVSTRSRPDRFRPKAHGSVYFRARSLANNIKSACRSGASANTTNWRILPRFW